MLVSSKLNRNDTMNGAQVKDCFIFCLLLFCDKTKEKLHLFQDFKWYFKYFDLLFAVSFSDQFLQSTEGSVMKWKWIFFVCFLFVYVRIGFRCLEIPKPFGENRDFLSLSVKTDKSSLLSILRLTCKQLTGKLRDSDEWPLGKGGSTRCRFRATQLHDVWKQKMMLCFTQQLFSDQWRDLVINMSRVWQQI